MTRLANLGAAPALVVALLSVAACGGRSALPASSASGPNGIESIAQRAQNAHEKNPCTKSACIYVGNEASSVTVYPATSSGNVPPVQAIVGNQTGLEDVWAVAVDASRNIYSANYRGNYGLGDLTVYATGSTGNVAPTATISGSSSVEPLLLPSGIGVDSAGNIYATGQSSISISVYAPGSNGTPTPIQYIHGSYTGLSNPDCLAVTPNGTTYVTNPGNASVTVYAAGANGNVAPIQTIAGSKTGISTPNCVAVDSKGTIYVSSSKPGYPTGCCVTIYDKDANGNVRPIRSIEGSKTQISFAGGIAVDPSGEVYVSNSNTNSVTVYAKHAHGNVAPIRVISGTMTGLDQPSDLTIH
jgi:6-phosphogluconolactonase (cycloisomerase 2 family)